MVIKKSISRETDELRQIDEGIDQLNFWFIVNTVFTIITGIGTLAIALIGLLKQ